ncbi:MAG TPA: hypothetical protein VEC14_14560 [Reyranellaceae bacterium]|nr:hypothetical protein [Reyranellaceae bacterium]
MLFWTASPRLAHEYEARRRFAADGGESGLMRAVRKTMSMSATGVARSQQ